MPILAGRVMATGQIDLIGILLSMVILFWIPTHIVSFSMRYFDDYGAAKIPTFPSTYGFEASRAVIALAAIIAAASMGVASVMIGVQEGLLRLMAILLVGLMEEHRVIERVLTALEQEARRAANGQSVRPGFFLEAALFIKDFADGCHHAKEEGVLFKAMQAAGVPGEAGPIAMMLAEHEQGRAFTRAMRKAAERWEKGDPSAIDAVVQNALGYVNLLRQHIHKEDHILFPLADRLIPAKPHWEHLALWRIPYFVFSVVGFLAILLTRILPLKGKLPTLVLSIVHGAAGMVIFLLPSILTANGTMKPSFALVGLGDALIGLGGLLLSLLRAGKPIVSRATILRILPVLLLLTTAAFVAGFTWGADWFV